MLLKETKKENKVCKDCFAWLPVYDNKLFCKWYKMRRFLFISRIMNDVCAHNPYIVQHMDPMNNLERGLTFATYMDGPNVTKDVDNHHNLKNDLIKYLSVMKSKELALQ